MTPPLSVRLEALLFAEGGPLSRKKLGALLECSPEDLSRAAEELSAALAGRGLALIRSETDLALATSQEVAGALEKAFEKELGREIGEAGLEVLAIILYRGPSSRAQVDYIRGVNSSSTVRTLLSRGLLERTENPKDAREYLYRPTAELLAHLGLRSERELPEYATIRGELAAFEKSQSEGEPFGHGHADAPPERRE